MALRPCTGMKAVTVLGSTGSIGCSALDVVRHNLHRFKIFSLAAGANTDRLAEQILEFRPEAAVVGTESALKSLTGRLEEAGLPRADWPELAWGGQALIDVATAEGCGFVLSAIVGVAGLEATYEAIRRGKQVGLANKETLVAGGELVMAAARAAGTELLPVDSEHNGAHQCLRAGRRAEVRRLILTASGGPFRETPAGEFPSVTPERALRHPTWKMGPRITIDSATLMNKGFEVIEACWLFDFSPKEVDVVIHPQSTIHAMVEYNDGSVIAQISEPDMRMPIQYAMTYPERHETRVAALDWTKARSWTFQPPDLDKFRLLRASYQALEAGGTATCTLNAADEVAVEAFLAGGIRFDQIADVVEETLDRVPVRRPDTVAGVLAADAESRDAAVRAVRARRC